LAEDEEALVGGGVDFVMAVGAAAVVDPAVGGFDHPAARLDDEPVSGFGPGHDVGGAPALVAASATVVPV
jgi:hypothetical protein